MTFESILPDPLKTGAGCGPTSPDQKLPPQFPEAANAVPPKAFGFAPASRLPGDSWCLDIFAAEPMLIKPEVDAWIAAQRLNRIAQAAVAEAVAAWAILLDRSAVIGKCSNSSGALLATPP